MAQQRRKNVSSEIKVAELFAGVGGFRLGLDGYVDPEHPEWEMPSAGPFKTIWANQWEPGTDRRQFAARCYQSHFGEDSVVNEDIHVVLDKFEAGEIDIPDVDMVVGGFPCQDYSVAKTLSQASGIEGRKGVLWWDIYRFLQLKKPTFGLFENVDRLYIYAEKTNDAWNLEKRIADGVMATAFPIAPIEKLSGFDIFEDPADNSEKFGIGKKASQFMNAGVMQGFHVVTAQTVAAYDGVMSNLGDVLIPDGEVPAEFFVPAEQVEAWETLKGAKSIERVSKSGHRYHYSEGKMAFPDSTDKPSRTILTGEGGVTPSRFKHVIKTSDGRLRRLVPDELDQLQCFPKGWTNTGMTDGQRAFCMGNALVTGIPHRIGKAMAERRKL